MVGKVLAGVAFVLGLLALVGVPVFGFGGVEEVAVGTCCLAAAHFL
jgi:hypothetical protein